MRTDCPCCSAPPWPHSRLAIPGSRARRDQDPDSYSPWQIHSPALHARPHQLENPAGAGRAAVSRLSANGEPNSAPGPLGETLRGTRVAIFTQCITDWLYPEMAHSIRDALHLLGAEVSIPQSQHCCGLPAMDSGARDTACRMARQTIETLEACDADYIVSGGTSCVVAVLQSTFISLETIPSGGCGRNVSLAG